MTVFSVAAKLVSKGRLESLIAEALVMSDEAGESLAGCYLQMALDALKGEEESLNTVQDRSLDYRG